MNKEHNCNEHGIMVISYGNTDTIRCAICGTRWEIPTQFDDKF